MTVHRGLATSANVDRKALGHNGKTYVAPAQANQANSLRSHGGNQSREQRRAFPAPAAPRRSRQYVTRIHTGLSATATLTHGATVMTQPDNGHNAGHALRTCDSVTLSPTAGHHHPMTGTPSGRRDCERVGTGRRASAQQTSATPRLGSPPPPPWTRRPRQLEGIGARSNAEFHEKEGLADGPTQLRGSPHAA